MTCGKLVTVKDVFKQIYSNFKPNCAQCEYAETTNYNSQFRCGAYWDKKTLSVYFNEEAGVFMWRPDFDCPLTYGSLDDEPNSMPGGMGI